MWDPKTAGIDEIILEAENLNVLLEIIMGNKDINNEQKNVLLGIALNTSAHILEWCKAEEIRHD